MISDRAARRRYVLVVIVLACVTLITLDQSADDKGPLGVAGRAAHRVVGPIAGAANSVFSPIGDWLAGLTDGGALRKDNRELRNRVQELESEIQAAEGALSENERFNELFGQVWLDDIPSVGATVIAGSPGNFERSVIVNRGSEAGIRAGQPVVGPGGLVGRIESAWQGGAKVVLITDPSFGVSVRLQDQRITGPAETSTRSGTLVLNLSSADLSDEQIESIVEGDVVETCGCDGSEYPPGIPLGFVEAVERQQSGIAVIVRIRPTLDRPSLELVKVMRWEPDDPVPPELVATTTPRSTTSTTSSDADGNRDGGG
jgi:rod shape-determining protein MreC